MKPHTTAQMKKDNQQKDNQFKLHGGAAALAILHGGPLAPVVLATVVGIGIYKAFKPDSDKPKY
jgi:hypothetical protein